MKKILTSLFPLCVLFVSSALQAQTKVRFYTNKGNFDADLYDAWQPITTDNFKKLVNLKFYDGLIFHRVVAGFVIQGGDPNGNGTGNAGYVINDEFDVNAKNIQKSLGMANSGPNTASCQFYINLVNNNFLDPNYPVFGIVTTNFSIVQTIGAVAVDTTNDKPLVDVVMDSIRVIAFPAAVSAAEQQAVKIEVYPNPVQANTTIKIESKIEEDALLQITDMTGKKIFEKMITLRTGLNHFAFAELQVGALVAGIYNVQVHAGNLKYHQRIVFRN